MWFKKKEIDIKFEKSKIKKIADSFKYAGKGIKSAFKSERNMKIHFLIMLLVIVSGYVFEISIHEWQICIILFGVVIGFEIVNTSVEVLVDLVMPNIDPRAKLAKDLAAGAVLAVAISSAIVGLTIFIPKLLELFI